MKTNLAMVLSQHCLCPLQDQMTAEQMSMLESGVGVLSLVPGEEFEERKTTRAVVELLW